MAAISWEIDSGGTICLLFLLCVLVVLILTAVYSLTYKVPVEFNYENRPSLLSLYFKGLTVALFRKQGVLIGEAPLRDRKTKAVALDCRIDHVNLAQYLSVCGCPTDKLTIPPCYLETYFLPLFICVATSDNFRLSPLGLIHVGQSVTQHSSVQHLLKEPFDCECTVLEYRPLDRGVEVHLSLKVFDRREMCLWEGVATFLSRGKHAQVSGSKSHSSGGAGVENGHIGGPKHPSSCVGNGLSPGLIDGEENDSRTLRQIVSAPGDLGVQYAKASGDWNPHHLWGWSARLMGYRRPIAHGMWTMARSLAWLQHSGKLLWDPPLKVDVQFKRPIFLPGNSVFSCIRQTEKDKYAFRVNDKTTGVPQLVGTATRL